MAAVEVDTSLSEINDEAIAANRQNGSLRH
jgi:hypothetical protein